MNIVYRSSWELKLYMYLDRHPNVLEWSSEEFYIGYRSPLDGKMHRYFPDAWVRFLSKDGEEKTFVVEVKPYKQTIPPNPPKNPKKPSKTFLTESKTWAINKSKFDAAKAYCEKKGWQFAVFTEKELGIKK